MVDGTCLVFDFDGTILDTEEPSYRAWGELWAAHGHDLVLADWQQTLGMEDVIDPWEALEALVGRRLDPTLNDRRRDRRDELQLDLEVRPGIRAWIAQAEDLGLPLGVASSSSINWVEGHLVRLGLREHFGCIVGRAEDVPSKPDPTSYLLACAQLDADPLQSVAVEDSPHGVSAAVAAGLFTVAFPHELTRSLDLSRADVAVSSLDALQLADTVAMARRRFRTGRGS
jgi:HAD superfamily hydrolase (TIGR01509 family)